MIKNIRFILLALLMLILVSCVPATGTPQSNIDVASTFMKARETYNASLLEGLFADSLQSFDVAAEADQYEDLYTYYKAVNWKFTAGECTEASTTLVNCNAQLANDWTRALDNGPYDMVFSINIENGKITTIRPLWNRDFINDNLVPFMTFLQENHASDFSTIRGSSEHFFPRGEATVALLKTYSAEFVAAQ